MTQRADFACIGSRAVEMATPLRKNGWSVETIWSGRRNRQFAKAENIAGKVLDSDKPGDWKFIKTIIDQP